MLKKKRTTYIVFAENQLSPHTNSLSLPIISHPSLMQQTRVRPSIRWIHQISACLWLNHVVSGLIHLTIMLFTLNFFTPTLFNLSLLNKLTCWTLMQKVRYHPKALTDCKSKISGILSILTLLMYAFSPFFHNTSTLSIPR